MKISMVFTNDGETSLVNTVCPFFNNFLKNARFSWEQIKDGSAKNMDILDPVFQYMVPEYCNLYKENCFTAVSCQNMILDACSVVSDSNKEKENTKIPDNFFLYESKVRTLSALSLNIKDESLYNTVLKSSATDDVARSGKSDSADQNKDPLIIRRKICYMHIFWIGSNDLNDYKNNHRASLNRWRRSLEYVGIEDWLVVYVPGINKGPINFLKSNWDSVYKFIVKDFGNERNPLKKIITLKNFNHEKTKTEVWQELVSFISPLCAESFHKLVAIEKNIIQGQWNKLKNSIETNFHQIDESQAHKCSVENIFSKCDFGKVLSSVNQLQWILQEARNKEEAFDIAINNYQVLRDAIFEVIMGLGAVNKLQLTPSKWRFSSNENLTNKSSPTCENMRDHCFSLYNLNKSVEAVSVTNNSINKLCTNDDVVKSDSIKLAGDENAGCEESATLSNVCLREHTEEVNFRDSKKLTSSASFELHCSNVDDSIAGENIASIRSANIHAKSDIFENDDVDFHNMLNEIENELKITLSRSVDLRSNSSQKDFSLIDNGETIGQFDEVNSDWILVLTKWLKSFFDPNTGVYSSQSFLKKSYFLRDTISLNYVGVSIINNIQRYDIAIYYAMDAFLMGKEFISRVMNNSDRDMIIKTSSLFLIYSCSYLLDYFKNVIQEQTVIQNDYKTASFRSVEYAISFILSIVDHSLDDLSLLLPDYSYASYFSQRINRSLGCSVSTESSNDQILNKDLWFCDTYDIFNVPEPNFRNFSIKRNAKGFNIPKFKIKNLLKQEYFCTENESVLRKSLAYGCIKKGTKIWKHLGFHWHIFIAERQLIDKLIKSQHFETCIKFCSSLMKYAKQEKAQLPYLDVLLVKFSILCKFAFKETLDIDVHLLKIHFDDGCVQIPQHLKLLELVKSNINELNSENTSKLMRIVFLMLAHGVNKLHFEDFNVVQEIFFILYDSCKQPTPKYDFTSVFIGFANIDIIGVTQKIKDYCGDLVLYDFCKDDKITIFTRISSPRISVNKFDSLYLLYVKRDLLLTDSFDVCEEIPLFMCQYIEKKNYPTRFQLKNILNKKIEPDGNFLLLKGSIKIVEQDRYYALFSGHHLFPGDYVPVELGFQSNNYIFVSREFLLRPQIHITHKSVCNIRSIPFLIPVQQTLELFISHINRDSKLKVRVLSDYFSLEDIGNFNYIYKEGELVYSNCEALCVQNRFILSVNAKPKDCKEVKFFKVSKTEHVMSEIEIQFFNCEEVVRTYRFRVNMKIPFSIIIKKNMVDKDLIVQVIIKKNYKSMEFLINSCSLNANMNDAAQICDVKPLFDPISSLQNIIIGSNYSPSFLWKVTYLNHPQDQRDYTFDMQYSELNNTDRCIAYSEIISF